VFSLGATLRTSLPVPTTVVIVVLGVLSCLVDNISAGTPRAAARSTSQKRLESSPASGKDEIGARGFVALVVDEEA
jgi:hypothetical protein